MMKRRNTFIRDNRSALFVSLFFVCLALFHLAFPSVLTQFLFRISAPVVHSWKGITAWTAKMTGAFESKQGLLDENQTLAQALARAEEKLLTFSVLQADNQKLQALYGRFDQGKSVIAAVLLSPPLSPYDTLVLDAGAREGVSLGALVRSINGSPIGNITEVFKDFSRLSLFSSPGTETAVRIGEKGVQGKAIGMGGGEFQISLPREFQVARGDPIVFPGISPLPFGVVQTVEFQETDYLQTVSFISPVNIHGIAYVLVDVSSDPVNTNEKRDIAH